MSDPLLSPSVPTALLAANEVVTIDPPPPYPSRERRSPRIRRQGRGVHGHTRLTSTADSDHVDAHIQRGQSPSQHSFPGSETEVGENTPLLAPPSPRSLRCHTHRLNGRRRSLSHTSLVSYASAAPSLAQTVISLFQPELDYDIDVDYDLLSDSERSPAVWLEGQEQCDRAAQRSQWDMCSRKAWRRYFRPVRMKVYHMALLHLMVLNFPYALAAWIYLFVFTLTGTTLMIALPLGTVLCFFDLLGARAFARGELALQSTFHRPLAYPDPYPPRPIFTRIRQPTPSEIEAGLDITYETSFYKNAYSMFTDATSYQALFYFLVIKPSITLILTITILVLFPVSFLLILPYPAFLRATRRLGIWQANVAIEGLYLEIS